MQSVIEIRIDKIVDSPYQGRLILDHIDTESEVSMTDLMRSIEQNGLLTPIAVRQIDENYELIDGHRRVEATKALGHDHIKAIVHEMNDRDAQVMSVVGNLQRKNLSPIEYALAFNKILEAGIFNDKRELSKAIGKDETYVGDVLNTLKMDKRIIEDLRKNGTTNDVRLLRTIRKIADTDDVGFSDEQFALYERFLNEGLSRQQVANIVKDDQSKGAGPKFKATPNRIEISLGRKLNKATREEIMAKLEKHLLKILKEYEA